MKAIQNTAPVTPFRALAATAALALALAFSTTNVSAQPAQPGGGHRHHGGGFEQMIPHVLGKAKAALNLNTSQQVMWDNVVAQGKAAREAGRANHAQVKAALQAELAKPAPDLAAVAAIADNVEQQNRSLRKQVRDQWLGVYATFTPEQKTVVRDLLAKKMARAEGFQAKMFERFRGQNPGS